MKRGSSTPSHALFLAFPSFQTAFWKLRSTDAGTANVRMQLNLRKAGTIGDPRDWSAAIRMEIGQSCCRSRH